MFLNLRTASVCIKPRDINELKTKLELLLKDKGLQDKFSRGGYDLVGREFTWDRVAERVEEVHNDLINRT
jgi:glycosyltransferase involved in cell wall biosynthesis